MPYTHSHLRCLAVGSALLLFAAAGCETLHTPQEMWHSMRQTFKLRGDDYRDPAEEREEEWRVAGDERRKEQAVEKDPDQWYRQYFMSEKLAKLSATSASSKRGVPRPKCH